jgi:hypothetical protein
MSYITVRVWVSRIRKTSPGHTSLAIFPHARTPEEGYISFAPVESGSISGPGKYYDFQHDRDEYLASSDDKPRGYWIGWIFGLDAQRMWRHLVHHIQHPPHYSLFNECATQVHHYLVIGGADKYASWWSRNVLLAWSPDDVEDYAKSVIAHTRHLGSREHKVKGAGTVF